MYLATPHSRRDLSSLPKDQTFAAEEQNLNWTTREVPPPLFSTITVPVMDMLNSTIFPFSEILLQSQLLKEAHLRGLDN